MKIIFINLPINKYDKDDISPPLGLLCIISSLSSLHVDTELLDLNLDLIRGLVQDGSLFIDYVIKNVLDKKPDLVAISSMCVNSHLGIEICHRLKKTNKNIITICGGPHYSLISNILHDEFGFDYVVKGEGEEQIYDIITTISNIKGKQYRARNKMGYPWDALECIDINKYFEMNRMNLMNMETGRGCKYNCRFCYSPAHWLHTRNYPIERVLSDISNAYRIGCKHLFFVNDNFVNDNKYVQTLCKELKLIKRKPSWSCYLTIPDLGRKIIALLSQAGCNSAYLGIDAVTGKQKAALRKNFIKNAESLNALVTDFVQNGITPTCAFIIDPFEWSPSENNKVYSLALKARLVGAELSMHYLTSFKELSNHRDDKQYGRVESDELRVRMMLDCPEVVNRNELSIKYPHLFPFHSRKVHSEKLYMRGLFQIHAAQNLLTHYPFEINDIISMEGYNLIGLLNKVYSKMPDGAFKNENMRQLKRYEREAFEEVLLKEYNFKRV